MPIDPTAIAAGAGGLIVGATTALATFRKTGPEVEGLAIKAVREVLEEVRRELAWKDEEIAALRRKLKVAEAVMEKITMGELPPHLS